MDFKQEIIENAVVFTIQVKRATVDISGNLKNAMLENIEQGNTNLIVDINQAEFVDSSFLGALVAGLKRATMKNGDLKIVGLQPPVRAMFELTRLYRIFDIHDEVAEAIKNFE